MLHIGRIAIFMFGTAFLAYAQQADVSIASIESLIRSRQYVEALKVTQSALSRTPNDSRLWTLKGIVLSDETASDEALRAFQKALTLSPRNVAALKGEAQLLYQADDKRAISLLDRILKIDPKDETAHEMLAMLEMKEGNCQAAIDHFLLSAETVANHPSSQEAYGYCLVQTRQPDKAIPIFEQLAAERPLATYLKYDLAVLLVETKQNEAALKILGPLLEKDQSDPELLSLASAAYEATGDTPKAVSLLHQAIVLNPANAGYYNAFVMLCLDHDSLQVGVDMINAGLQHIPNDSSLYISRGLIYAQLAEYDKAEADFNTAERLDPGQSLSAYALDIAKLQKNMNLSDGNHSDKGLLEVRAQLRAHPESALLHYLLASLLANQQSGTDTTVPEEAMKSALLAVQLKPDFVQARDLLANIYINSGQYDHAAEQCRLALQQSPADKTAVYHLIIALRHSKESEQRNEISALVKRLSELQQRSLQKETDRKRFRLVEPQSPAAK